MASGPIKFQIAQSRPLVFRDVLFRPTRFVNFINTTRERVFYFFVANPSGDQGNPILSEKA